MWCSIARALRAAHSQRKGREEGPGHFFSLLATSNRSIPPQGRDDEGLKGDQSVIPINVSNKNLLERGI